MSLKIHPQFVYANNTVKMLITITRPWVKYRINLNTISDEQHLQTVAWMASLNSEQVYYELFWYC